MAKTRKLSCAFQGKNLTESSQVAMNTCQKCCNAEKWNLQVP